MTYTWVHDSGRARLGRALGPLPDRPARRQATGALATVFGNSMFTCFGTHGPRRRRRVLADGLDAAYIADVAVHPDHQGRGLGHEVIRQLVELSRGHKKIILYANPGAEPFYPRSGSSRCGRRWRSGRPAMAIRSGVLSDSPPAPGCYCSPAADERRAPLAYRRPRQPAVSLPILNWDLPALVRGRLSMRCHLRGRAWARAAGWPTPRRSSAGRRVELVAGGTNAPGTWLDLPGRA